MEHYKTLFFFVAYKRWIKEITTFGDIKLEKHKFHHRKNITLLEDVDIKKMQMFSMVSSGKKSYK